MEHNRIMDSILKKWLTIVGSIIIAALLSGVVTFIQMGSAVAENSKDIETIKQKTEIVTELRVRQEHLIDDVQELSLSVKDNAKILQQILREVKK